MIRFAGQTNLPLNLENVSGRSRAWIFVNHLTRSDVFIRISQMQKILFTMVMIGLSGLIFGTQAMAGKIEQRQVLQHKKIWQGVASGQLTRYETRNLWHEQQKIQRVKKSFWRDGRLNRRERSHLFLWLDNADRHIFQLKHNSRRKPAIWQRASYHRHKRFW
jgi:hypothetical protein